METKIKTVGSGTQKVSVVAVLADLEEEILASGLSYSAWVCGITHAPISNRLTGRHRPTIGTLKCWNTESELDARQIEIILRRKGCQVLRHPGGHGARYVFIFLPQEEVPS